METIRYYLGIPSYCVDLSKYKDPILRKAEWYEQLLHFLPTFFRQKSVYLLDSWDLDRLSRTCDTLQKSILGQPNDETVKKNLATIRITLQCAVDYDFFKCPVAITQTVANNILRGTFSEFHFTEFRLWDAQEFANCIIYELEQACAERNTQKQIECITRLSEFRTEQQYGPFNASIREVSDKIGQTWVVPFKRVILENDLGDTHLSSYIVELSTLSPKVAIAHCQEIQRILPGKLTSLSTMSEKFKALKAISISDDMYAHNPKIPQEVRTILGNLLKQEADKLIKQIPSPYAWQPGADNDDVMHSLRLIYQNLSEKEFINLISTRAPSLLPAYQSHLVQPWVIEESLRLPLGSPRDFHKISFPEDLKTMMQRSILLREGTPQPLESQQPDPKLAKSVESLFQTITKDSFIYYCPPTSLLLFAEVYRTLKEVFKLTIPDQSIDNFDQLKDRMKTVDPRLTLDPLMERSPEQMTPQALVKELPLVEEQKNALLQALTMRGSI